MLDDKTITMDLLTAAKEEVNAYARACNETASPELRDILAKQLQMAQKAQERIFNFAKKAGYYDPYAAPEQMLSSDMQQANKIIQQITWLK
jgi:spore coat protein CotF